MQWQWIAVVVCVIGAGVTLVDLGNRLFGCYRKTVPLELMRSGIVAVSAFLLTTPALLWLMGLQALPVAAWLATAAILAVLETACYLFPYRFGIRRAPGNRAVEKTLRRAVLLMRETVEAPCPVQREIRCLALTDLHAGRGRRRPAVFRQIVESLADDRFDLVFLLGDAGDRAGPVEEMMGILKGIQSAHGFFYVRGNHDLRRYDECVLAEILAKHRIVHLQNATRTIPELGVTLAGLGHPWSPGPLPELPPDTLPIGLSHSPDNIFRFQQMGIPIALSGHTHGGEYRFPLLGPVFIPSRYGRVLDQGWFDYKGTRLYVCPGLGYFIAWPGRTSEILDLRIREREGPTKHTK